MQKIDISYNPYKMETEFKVNGTDVCKADDYIQFKEFIETDTPLQTWAEPIPYKNWQGVVNELASDDCFDKLVINFSGRKMDFEDLKRACDSENEKRTCKLEIEYNLVSELNDAKLAQNIEVVMQQLQSKQFADLMKEYKEGSEAAKIYSNLKDNYKRAKNKEFKIVFAGLYSSGKSTILNALVHRNILPTSDETCTSKTCRLKHDKSLNGKISLTCLDALGKQIDTAKWLFDTDEECLEKFWEITPLGAKKSNPENVETIEIGLDLSHLYPSKEMEKDFNLVIVDTPGCNSSKTKGAEKGIKQDIKIALDAITGGEKEMVVICADAQDYEDESLGEFLKAINESVEEENDKGDFNDRFLFVLNKCDALKFNSEHENIGAKKEKFANYLMDTKRWGIEKQVDSPKFVPKIFMVCAYIQFAVQMGVADFSRAELKDKFKKNLFQVYRTFSENILVFEDTDYFLSQVCDVPEYLRMNYKKRFEHNLNSENDAAAVAIQSGMDCIEDTIRDYIARYAYPFKVRDLMDTFDMLLKEVDHWNCCKENQLRETINEMGKNISEREEAGKEKEDREEKERKLNLLKEKVSIQKEKISSISFDEKKLQKIREDMEVEIESERDIEKIRNSNKVFTKAEIFQLVESIDMIFNKAYATAIGKFDTLTGEYKNKLETICNELRIISQDLESGKDYGFGGYKFADSLGAKKINKMNVNSLRAQVESTKKTVKEGKYVEVRNPVKDEKYKWWQFGKKIKQSFASEMINKYIEEEKDVYNAVPLKIYLERILGDFAELCSETAKNYSSDINKIKQQAIEMADDIPKDIEAISEMITDFNEKIKEYGNNVGALEAQMEIIKRQKVFIKELVNAISVGGQYEQV